MPYAFRIPAIRGPRYSCSWFTYVCHYYTKRCTCMHRADYVCTKQTIIRKNLEARYNTLFSCYKSQRFRPVSLVSSHEWRVKTVGHGGGGGGVKELGRKSWWRRSLIRGLDGVRSNEMCFSGTCDYRGEPRSRRGRKSRSTIRRVRFLSPRKAESWRQKVEGRR